MHFPNIESYLKALLDERTKVNSRYSLRSMAKALNISPSGLSAMFNKQRQVSLKMIDHLGQGLDLSQDEILYFKERNILDYSVNILKEQGSRKSLSFAAQL
jgi:plasmid maintenance system antidote protein VapI